MDKNKSADPKGKKGRVADAQATLTVAKDALDEANLAGANETATAQLKVQIDMANKKDPEANGLFLSISAFSDHDSLEVHKAWPSAKIN